MTSTTKIYTEFSKFSYQRDSRLTKSQILQVLNQLFKTNAYNKINHKTYFDSDVLQDLWQQTINDIDDEYVVLADFVQVIQRAQIQLYRRIQQSKSNKLRIQGEKRKNLDALSQAKNRNEQRNIIKLKQKDQRDQHELKKCIQELQGYQNDYLMVTVPFKITTLNPQRQQNQILTSGYKNNQKMQASKSIIKSVHSQSSKFHKTKKQYNFNLKILFWFTVVLVFLQLLVEFCLSVVAIFTLDYFDSRYNKFLMVQLAFTILMDGVWLMVKYNDWYYPGINQSITKMNGDEMRFIVIVVIILIFVKTGIIIILFGFKDVSGQNIYYMKVFKEYESSVGGNEQQNPVTYSLKKLFNQIS